MVPETSVSFNRLTRLTVREGFISFSRHEYLRSLKSSSTCCVDFLLGLFLDPEDGGSSSEKSVKFYRTAWCHIREDTNIACIAVAM
jgi:hypothetical protein